MNGGYWPDRVDFTSEQLDRMVKVRCYWVLTCLRHARIFADLIAKHGARCVHIQHESKKMDTYRVTWK